MLIGLKGRAGAGKDTAYERLTALFGDERPVTRVAFADALYESAAAALGVMPAQLRAWKNDEVRIEIYRYQARKGPRGGRRVHSLSVRQYLQLYGTEAHRDVFGSDFWVRVLHENPEDAIIVVTDCRFPNEAEHVKSLDGYVAVIEGPSDLGGVEAAHESEADLPADLIDYWLDNSVRDDGYAQLDSELRSLVGDIEARAKEATT